MLPSLVPGFVEGVEGNRENRIIRVSFAPYTDGATEWPEAQMCYPMGDDSDNTEIRIVVGKPVWLAFLGGDPRYPIIMGARPVYTGNEQSTRRWDHDNFELNADDNYVVNAGKNITLIGGETITLQVAGSTLKIDASTIAALAATIKLN